MASRAARRRRLSAVRTVATADEGKEGVHLLHAPLKAGTRSAYRRTAYSVAPAAPLPCVAATGRVGRGDAIVCASPRPRSRGTLRRSRVRSLHSRSDHTPVPENRRPEAFGVAVGRREAPAVARRQAAGVAPPTAGRGNTNASTGRPNGDGNRHGGTTLPPTGRLTTINSRKVPLRLRNRRIGRSMMSVESRDANWCHSRSAAFK